MKRTVHWLLTPSVTGAANILIIRWMIASISAWESVTAFLNGAPLSFLNATGILAAILLLLGLLTRVACLLCIVEIIASLFNIGRPGSFLRLEYAELLTCLYLFLEGPGRISLDFRISTANKIYRIS